MQQPFNEEIATAVAKCLSIPHVAYWVTWDDETPYSLCEDFITQDTELVSAWRVMQTQKRDNSTSIYQHYLNCCKALGVPVDMVHHLDQMIVLDYLIANEDRHQNNFGLVRNAVTLEWIGPAPIFDSGSSLGYDKLPNQILSGKNIECKPFKKTHEEQLNLVSSFDWIDFKQLNGVEDEIRSILDKAGEYLDQTRKDAICVSVKRRVEHLMELAMTHHTVIDHREDDVETDFAADYTPKMEF